MSKTCTVTVADQTNVLFTGLDASTNAKCKSLFTFWSPGYRFSPAYKLGRWDGKVSLWKDGWTQLNLLSDELFDAIEASGYDIIIDDRRPALDMELRLVGSGEQFGSVVPRPYQVEAANHLLTNRTGMLKMATGSGKSYVCGIVASRYAEHGRVMVIVPSINLVKQTADSFRALGIELVGEFNGETKEVENVTVTTWQSLANYPELLVECLAVIVDEAHQASAQVLSEMLKGAGRDVPFRFGCTGTVPKEPLAAAQVRAAVGDVLFTKEAWELQEDGVLANCRIDVVQTVEKRTFDDNVDEMRFLTQDGDRLEWVAGRIVDVSQSGNTMVLVRNVKPGKQLTEMIQRRTNKKVVFISGSVKTKSRKIHYDSLADEDDVILVCTAQTSAVGIDAPRIFNLVLFEIGKSFTTTIQGIGRSLRRAEDKSFAVITDICADTKYSKRHLSERKAFYKEAKYPYTIEKAKR